MRNSSSANRSVIFAASLIIAVAALAVGCTPAPAAQAPARSRTAEIHIESEPSGAKIILDGAVAGTTPLTVPDLSPGYHELYVHMPGYRTEIIDLLLEGESRRITVDLTPLPGTSAGTGGSGHGHGPREPSGPASETRPPAAPSPRLHSGLPVPATEAIDGGWRFGPVEWVAGKTWAAGGLVAAVHMAQYHGAYYIGPDGTVTELAAADKGSPLVKAYRLPAGRGLIAAHRSPDTVWWYRDGGDDVLLHEGASFNVSPDGRLVLLFADDGPAAVFDLDTGEKTTFGDIATGNAPDPGADTDWLPGSRRFLAPRLLPGGGAELAAYEGDSREEIWSLERRGHALVPAVSPYGQWVAAVVVPADGAAPAPVGILPHPFGTSLMVIDTSTRRTEEFSPGGGDYVLGPPVWDEGGTELLFAVGSYRMSGLASPVVENSEIWAMKPLQPPEPVEAASLITGAKYVDSVSPGGRYITAARQGDFLTAMEVWLVDREEGTARPVPGVYPPVKWVGPERFLALGEMDGHIDLGLFHVDGSVTPLPTPPGGQLHAVTVMPGSTIAAMEWSRGDGDEIYIDIIDLEGLH